MRVFRVSKIVALVAVAAAVLSIIVMHLWNWLMPAIFGLRAITFAQALGLLLLSKILFGGFHRHGGRRGGWRGREWKRKMKDRWDKMSPEERERFKAGMRASWNCRPRQEHPWAAQAATRAEQPGTER